MQRPLGVFHAYAFNTTRQLGANFEMLSSHLAWLETAEQALRPASEAATRLAVEAKAFQFQLARAFHRRSADGLAPRLDRLAAPTRTCSRPSTAHSADRGGSWLGSVHRRCAAAGRGRPLASRSDAARRLGRPGDLSETAEWIPAPVPGTAAAALRDAGRWSETAPTPIHDQDVWYRTRLTRSGAVRLRFEGLATLAEVWLDGVPVLVSRSMFETYAIETDLRPGPELALCFRSLRAELDRPSKRGRWRPRMITPGSLRHVRTSLLGFMPAGARRSTSSALPSGDRGAPAPRRDGADLRAAMTARRPDLRAPAVDGHPASVTLHCDGARGHPDGIRARHFTGTLALPGVPPWWPHTHGTPHRHPVSVEIDGTTIDLGRTGFRALSLARPFAEGWPSPSTACRSSAGAPTGPLRTSSASAPRIARPSSISPARPA